MTAARTPSPIENGASWISSDAVESSLMRRCVPESVRHAREEFAREAGNLVDEAREFALAEHDELHVGLGDDGGVAGRLLEQRKLAERVARAELRDLAAAPGYAGPAVEDHEELVARLTL